jgi:hypothetical protein
VIFQDALAVDPFKIVVIALHRKSPSPVRGRTEIVGRG